MYSDLEKFLPKQILKHLPYAFEENRLNAFQPLVEAYRELKRGNDIGLFKYRPISDGIDRAYNNYDTNLDNFMAKVRAVELCSPDKIKVVIPRKPSEIAKELHQLLTNYDLTEEEVVSTVKAITGYKKASEFDNMEKQRNLVRILFKNT